jgi:hypothetical protein
VSIPVKAGRRPDEQAVVGEMAQELGLQWSITSRLVATLAVAV